MRLRELQVANVQLGPAQHVRGEGGHGPVKVVHGEGLNGRRNQLQGGAQREGGRARTFQDETYTEER